MMLSVERARSLLSSLHPDAIREETDIRRMLHRLWEEGVRLRRGVNRRIEPEVALVRRVDEAALVLATENLDCRAGEVVLLNFQLDGRPYGVSVRVLEAHEGQLVVDVPDAIYLKERRDRRRVNATLDPTAPRSVALSTGEKAIAEATIHDFSADGLAIELPVDVDVPKHAPLKIVFLDGAKAGIEVIGTLRHEHACSESQGWKRVGLSTLMRSDALVPIERRERLAEGRSEAIQQSLSFVSGSARLLSTEVLSRLRRNRVRVPPSVPVVEYKNARGEEIKAIVDSWGDPRKATAVVIPPAWGRTKETLLPLAATIVATFKAARCPIVVVRFDGIRRRGESYNDIDCRTEGREYHRFTFSQGIDDISTTLTFVESSLGVEPGRSVLVTFSAASIDGRRAAAELGNRLAGWVCVVGSADLQSMMRVVSGGLDLVAGVERGVRFGLTEILGVEVDIDLAGRDALEHRMAFLEDSCRDFSRIQVPITWLHGRYDAWMDLERVQAALSHGRTSNRRLLEIPTGHQLRSSREALGVFQLVAAEVGRLSGVAVRPRLPKLEELEARSRAERHRLPKKLVKKQDFWRRYLLGPDGTLGIELMTSTSHYRRFMRLQVEALQLAPESCVLDLGSGTGSFPLELARSGVDGKRIRVVEVDYVRESLLRARSRINGLGTRGPVARFACVDLDGEKLPFRDRTFDAVLASLVINYVQNAERLVKEVRRVLKPGGRLVISGMRKDADISKLYRDGVEELIGGTIEPIFAREEARDLGALSRSFLNEAARLMDYEEIGVFKFFEAEELANLLRAAGFRITATREGFGSPPQALVIEARRGT